MSFQSVKRAKRSSYLTRIEQIFNKFKFLFNVNSDYPIISDFNLKAEFYPCQDLFIPLKKK